MENSELQFMPYAVQMNYKKRIEEIFSFTEAENDAVNTYQGNSVMLNELLGNYVSDQAVLVPNMSYYTTDFSTNRETVAKLLQEAQNLYSAMAKKSFDRKRRFRFYRGASKSLGAQEELPFISTTTGLQEAINWATSNNRHALEHYFIELNVEEGVPLLFMPGKGVEEEVLISPFVDVENISIVDGRANGMPIKKQIVKVKRKDLREMSEEEMLALQEEILADADSMSALARECIIIQREIKAKKIAIADYRIKMNIRYQDFSANKISYEDFREYEKRYAKEKEDDERELQEKLEELKVKGAPLEEWKRKIRRLIEGKCKEIENGIQRQMAQAMDVAREETNQIAQENFRREQEEAERERQNAATIRSKIGYVQSLLINPTGEPGNVKPLQRAIEWRNKFKSFQIPYDSPTERCLVAISRMGYDCESAHDGILERASQITKLPQQLMNLQGTEESLDRAEINEFARSLEALVVGIRVCQEERILVNAKNTNEAQKIGFVGKLLGKEKKQHEASNQIDMQLQQLRNFSVALHSNGLNHDFRYSVHDILAEIQIAISKGLLTEQELANLERYKNAIVKTLPIRQDRFETKYNEKTQGNLANYDTGVFIEQYSKRIDPSHFRGRRVTMAENICNRIANQIAEDERWQKQRERNSLHQNMNDLTI